MCQSGYEIASDELNTIPCFYLCLSLSQKKKKKRFHYFVYVLCSVFVLYSCCKYFRQCCCLFHFFLLLLLSNCVFDSDIVFFVIYVVSEDILHATFEKVRHATLHYESQKNEFEIRTYYQPIQLDFTTSRTEQLCVNKFRKVLGDTCLFITSRFVECLTTIYHRTQWLEFCHQNYSLTLNFDTNVSVGFFLLVYGEWYCECFLHDGPTQLLFRLTTGFAHFYLKLNIEWLSIYVPFYFGC